MRAPSPARHWPRLASGRDADAAASVAPACREGSGKSGGSGRITYRPTRPTRPTRPKQSKPHEQLHCRIERLVSWSVEPLQRTRIAAPDEDVQHSAREIDPMDLGLAVRPQPIARIPQTAHDACRDAPRTSGALIGSIRCDALGLEAVDAALGIV